MSDNLFHKTMQGNFSQSPHDHEEALSVLAENNYSIIPEIYHYDNEKYCCQMIEDAVSLKQHIEETACFDIANNVIQDVTLFFLEVSKNTRDGLHLIPDDLHDENLIIEKIYYKIVRLVDDAVVVDYGNGTSDASLNKEHTLLSYDASGSYFDFDMSNLESGYMYGIKFMLSINGELKEQDEVFKFRVD